MELYEEVDNKKKSKLPMIIGISLTVLIILIIPFSDLLFNAINPKRKLWFCFQMVGGGGRRFGYPDERVGGGGAE